MELHALQPGYMLYEYRIEKKLGEGGFGITYLALDTHLDMRVAIKEYLPSDFAMRQSDVTIAPKSLALKESFDWGLNAFIDEAKTIAQFDALNIVKIHRFFKANGTAYIVMEYCDGGSLKERIMGKPFSELATRSLLEDLAKGLQVVHGNHVFHRDIKPDNIMFRSNGTPVLIDFGAARQSVEGQTRTVTSMVTPGFAPPEQYSQNTKFGPWTDIYALAAVAFTCLKGHKPSDSVQRMVEDDYQPLGQAPQASGFLQAIDWGLQLAASQRPQNLKSWLASWDNPFDANSMAADDNTVLLSSADKTVLEAPVDSRSSSAQTSFGSPQTNRQPSSSPATAGGAFKYIVIFGITLVLIGMGFYGYHNLQQENNEIDTIPEVIVKESPSEYPIPKNVEATGQIWITTDPANAQVEILDVDAKYSAGMSLKLGRYGIKVNAAGYQDKIEFVNILSANNNVAITLAPLKGKTTQTAALGKLWITPSPSHAQIVLLDIEPRYTPGMQLQPGSYRIKLMADGYEDKVQNIDINNGDNNFILALTPEVAAKPPEVVSTIPLPKMVAIAGGNFEMGSNNGESNEQPVHTVTIKNFSVGQSEVTFTQWDACVQAAGCRYKPHDEGWGRGNRPVINVSYKDITEDFIPWLNKTTGQVYRLPTEAEWEYVARAGRNSRYSWGYTINCSQARYGYLSGECKKRQNTDRVKSFLGNSFGVYDLHGNVWEWTQDCWNDNYVSAPSNGEAWNKGDCSQRVLRGGSWLSRPDALRSAYRFRNKTTVRNNDLGFRLAQDR